LGIDRCGRAGCLLFFSGTSTEIVGFLIGALRIFTSTTSDALVDSEGALFQREWL
jgi:hypothetical protein